MRTLLSAMAGALALASLSCSGSSGSGSCDTPGASTTCTCGAGRSGSRVCGADGAWSICDCGSGPCDSAADCDPARPLCYDGYCVGCVTSGDCGGASPICDPADHLCVGCLGDADCPHGVCELATRTCNPEDCVNGADDDANGATDCVDAACWEVGPCRTAGPCTVAADCGAPGDQVCISGTCEIAGARAPAGGVARGELRFDLSLVSTANPVRSVRLRLFHPLRADGRALDCQALTGLPYETPPELNEVRSYVTNFSSSLAAPSLPASGEQRFLALFQGFAAPADAGGAHGYQTVEACVENLAVPAGAFADDASHVRAVSLEPACGGPQARQCPDELTCVIGVCIDARCAPCAPGSTCREVDGAPACYQSCNPAEPSCPNLYRCDAAPGYPSVCVRSD